MSACPRPFVRCSDPLWFALRVVALSSALLVTACSRTEGTPKVSVVRTEWSVSPDDRVGECADVGELRACWSGRGRGDVRLVPRRTPLVRPSRLGFRCYGARNAVRCVDRSRDAPPFRCDGPSCRQRAPRMPDDGEWECADFAGIVVCHGSTGAAGVPPGATEPGFVCGPRRGARAATGERVCIDLSPDFPDGKAEGQRCRFETDGALFRVCAADASADVAGGPCDHSRACDAGLVCVEGRCLPPRPEPACWLDGDCDKGACRFRELRGGGHMRAWTPALFAWALLSGCGRGKEPAFLVVAAPSGAHLDLGTARVEGTTRSVTLSSGKLVIEREARAADDLTVRVAGACPLRVAGTDLTRGATAERALAPWFDFGRDRAEVGFGARLLVTAAPGCREARETKITWTQTEGEPLGKLDVSENGHTVSATMPALANEARAPGLAVIPFSPRTRGEIVLRATWAGPDGVAERVVRASAAARSRGLSNVAVNTRLYLSGEGVALAAAPPGSRSAVETPGAVASFEPDVPGSYTLTAAGGARLTLYAGRYDETPLDCGRSDCHAGIAASARSSPMATIFQRGLDGPFAGDYPSCALGCHTVGEPGVEDGGFLTISTALGWSPAELRRAGFHDLPAPLRRLGGVGCLACHGPGTVAEPRGRHALLRADVCATCHDAPPRYGHVVAWRTSRMARADADPRTRADRACARCHTTWGFLGRSDHAPPDDAPPTGIACAACHAVHPAAEGRGTVVGATCAEALRRDVPLPAILEGALPPRSERSRACLGCHAPAADESVPSASATAIWAGRGGLDPVSGAPLTAVAEHGNVDGGCVGCHHSGPAGLGLGAGHAFAVHDDACGACHPSRSDPSIRERALALSARGKNVAPGDRGPPHAAKASYDRTTPRGRAEWDLALVLEDPAADRHNAAYARALLDAAERVVGPAHGGRGGARP